MSRMIAEAVNHRLARMLSSWMLTAETMHSRPVVREPSSAPHLVGLASSAARRRLLMMAPAAASCKRGRATWHIAPAGGSLDEIAGNVPRAVLLAHPGHGFERSRLVLEARRESEHHIFSIRCPRQRVAEVALFSVRDFI
jgi:hypothetical protein